MPLSPEIKAVIDEAAQKPLFNTMPIEQARAFIANMSQSGFGDIDLPKVAKIHDEIVKSPEAVIPVRIYQPLGDGPFPLVVNFHGGGFALGGLDMDDFACRGYCEFANCVVVSVDYRLAPEHKFPAAIEDAYFVTSWARTEQFSTTYNTDPARTVTAGMSAGGNLATVVPLMLRDRGEKQVQGQLLEVPVTSRPGHPETQSYKDYYSGYMLPAEEMYWFWEMYTAADTCNHPYAAPMNCEDLSNLPPAFVLTGECDILRDEGEAYAQKLRKAGVQVQATRYDGVDHFVTAFSAISDISRRAIQDKHTWLNDILSA